VDHNNKEAEDVVLDTLVNEVDSEFNIKLNLEEIEELSIMLDDETGISLM